jgi:two-component system osmolarity sensor histidine kinase EnvZ
MERMLNDYLQFAKTQAVEETSNVNIKNLFSDIKNSINDKNLIFTNIESVILKSRVSSLKRCFENIIQNGLIYGEKVYVRFVVGKKILTINIEDDGPGIPDDQYKNVFKPFFRLDESRNLNKAGVGLGLTIVEDIINSHGGNIQLGKSKHNGLLVKISLPF